MQDGESQEARLFQNISIKQEYYQPLQEVGLQLHTSPYFNHNSNTPICIEILDNQQSTQEIASERTEVGDCDVGSPSDSIESIQPKKTKRKKHKVKVEENGTIALQDIVTEAPKRPALDLGSDNIPLKQKKKIDRFDGMPEEEVAKKFLPDHLGPNMDILIIGINPGLFAAHKGHHYAGPGNHFWKCMYLSGLIPEPFTAYDDFRLLDYGIGFTNMVARTTRGSANLTREEIKKGSEILLTKLKQYQPRIAVFNGKGIYEIFSGKKQFNFGKQPEMVDGTNTHIWVMPSSSARCAQLPRALDKVPFYSALRKYRDYLKGIIPEVDEDEITFSHVRLSNPKTPVKQEVKLEQDDMAEPKKTFNSESARALKAFKGNIKSEQNECSIKSENPS
ncbi:G/T mismatch-specific thymine DNA glycosylase-like [Penaeus indicus]|uniref:G/T mismatch-specific thymine DNA glycosylase-like n=1 Tax=Penaeus indicus TaxID=29960 RepID=UPI00300CD216